MDWIVKGIIAALVMAAITTTYLAWHHSIVEEGVHEQQLVDAPVMGQCKTAFETADPKKCGAALEQRLKDADKALAENEKFAQKIADNNAAVALDKAKSDKRMAEADAKLALASVKEKNVVAALDKYQRILSAPSGPRNEASCHEATAIIHELLVRP